MKDLPAGGGRSARRIGLEALIAALRDNGRELALLDVREEGQFGMGHPLWAVNTPYSRLESVVSGLVPRTDCPIVLLDADDGVAEQAARRLAALGYTDVAVLRGGIPAWGAAGHPLFNGVYVPGKVLGEWTEHRLGTPSIDADALQALRAQRRPLLILDPRTEAEHAARHVPDAVSCPNGELLYRYGALAPSPDTLVVVACGGRTRGIVGAQTLIDAGVPHRVVALADGNHGWQLAGHALETGLLRRAGAPDSVQAAEARARAAALAKAHGVPVIDLETLQAWRRDPARTTIVLDVRTPQEYALGSLDGARSAPGGQLVQASDRWLGTLRARVVLVDDDGVRAVQTALWLRRLGWQASALRMARQAADAAAPATAAADAATGLSADRAARIDPEAGDVPRVASEIDAGQAHAQWRDGAQAVCVDGSEAFLNAHPPGAKWANRARLDAVLALAHAGKPLLLFSSDGRLAQLAAADVLEDAPGARVAVVRGGEAAWAAAGLPLEAGAEGDLAREDRIDFLYWAHDRRRGNAQAMKAYLDWEKQLVAQAEREPGGFPLALPADA